MKPRSRWFWTIAAFLLVLYGGWRIFVHAGHLKPAVVTPQMDARQLISMSLDARAKRLLRERAYAARSTRQKLIALTFDDGPFPVTTPLLLDELRSLHVPATFFLIGRDARQWPEITQRIEAAGDEIGDHTLTHPDLDKESAAKVRAEIAGGARVLWALSHDPASRKYFRPPHGRYTLQTIRIAQQLGFTTVLWSDDAGDWRTVTPASLAAHVELHATAPEILLLHDGKLPTAQMLPAVVARFRKAGYRFVTVGELLARVPPQEINHPAKHSV